MPGMFHWRRRVNRCRSVSMSEPVIYSPALRWDGPGLTGVCRAGLTFHGHRPAGAGLTVGSTSVFGLRATPGDYELGEVDRGVEITVADHAAALAGEGAPGKRQFGFHCLAGRAGL